MPSDLSSLEDDDEELDETSRSPRAHGHSCRHQHRRAADTSSPQETQQKVVTTVDQVKRIRDLLHAIQQEPVPLRQLRRLRAVVRHFSNCSGDEIAHRDPALPNDCLRFMLITHDSAPARLKPHFLLPFKDTLFCFEQFAQRSAAFRDILADPLMARIRGVVETELPTDQLTDNPFSQDPLPGAGRPTGSSSSGGGFRAGGSNPGGGGSDSWVACGRSRRHSRQKESSGSLTGGQRRRRTPFSGGGFSSGPSLAHGGGPMPRYFGRGRPRRTGGGSNGQPPPGAPPTAPGLADSTWPTPGGGPHREPAYNFSPQHQQPQQQQHQPLFNYQQQPTPPRHVSPPRDDQLLPFMHQHLGSNGYSQQLLNPIGGFQAVPCVPVGLHPTAEQMSQPLMEGYSQEPPSRMAQILPSVGVAPPLVGPLSTLDKGELLRSYGAKYTLSELLPQLMQAVQLDGSIRSELPEMTVFVSEATWFDGTPFDRVGQDPPRLLQLVGVMNRIGDYLRGATAGSNMEVARSPFKGVILGPVAVQGGGGGPSVLGVSGPPPIPGIAHRRTGFGTPAPSGHPLAVSPQVPDGHDVKRRRMDIFPQPTAAISGLQLPPHQPQLLPPAPATSLAHPPAASKPTIIQPAPGAAITGWQLPVTISPPSKLPPSGGISGVPGGYHAGSLDTIWHSMEIRKELRIEDIESLLQLRNRLRLAAAAEADREMTNAARHEVRLLPAGGGTRFTCRLCGNQFQSYRERRYHLMLHLIRQPDPRECETYPKLTRVDPWGYRSPAKSLLTKFRTLFGYPLKEDESASEETRQVQEWLSQNPPPVERSKVCHVIDQAAELDEQCPLCDEAFQLTYSDGLWILRGTAVVLRSLPGNVEVRGTPIDKLRSLQSSSSEAPLKGGDMARVAQLFAGRDGRLQLLMGQAYIAALQGAAPSTLTSALPGVSRYHRLSIKGPSSEDLQRVTRELVEVLGTEVGDTAAEPPPSMRPSAGPSPPSPSRGLAEFVAIMQDETLSQVQQQKVSREMASGLMNVIASFAKMALGSKPASKSPSEVYDGPMEEPTTEFRLSSSLEAVAPSATNALPIGQTIFDRTAPLAVIPTPVSEPASVAILTKIFASQGIHDKTAEPSSVGISHEVMLGSSQTATSLPLSAKLVHWSCLLRHRSALQSWEFYSPPLAPDNALASARSIGQGFFADEDRMSIPNIPSSIVVVSPPSAVAQMSSMYPGMGGQGGSVMGNLPSTTRPAPPPPPAPDFSVANPIVASAPASNQPPLASSDTNFQSGASRQFRM